jgi:hypothetical protein
MTTQSYSEPAPGQDQLPPRSSEADPGFVMAMRYADGLELIAKNHHAYVLLAVIAMRARRTDALNRHNLKLGEALLGDYREYSMTMQEYRTAKKVLEDCGLATFKATNKGTVARIISTRVFDINEQRSNKPPNNHLTVGQQAANKQLTTNKEWKKEKNGKGTLFLRDQIKAAQELLDEARAKRDRLPKPNKYTESDAVLAQRQSALDEASREVRQLKDRLDDLKKEGAGLDETI